MAKILETKSLYYNDVNLIAQPGQVKSRTEIPKELNRIIVSPMAAVVGESFAMEAANLGLTVCLHRFDNVQRQREIYESIDHKTYNYNTQNTYCSIGFNDLDRVKYLVNYSAVSKWVLDIANGYLPNIKEELSKILEIAKVESLIIGNIHTKSGLKYLISICEELNIQEIIVRCGLSGGSPCQTSDIVGINRGNITEIMECYEILEQYKKQCNIKVKLCADGGISKPSFACKAFAAGSSHVMLGGYWMNSLEAESNLNGDGSYWGGASHKQQILSKGRIVRHSEGKEIPKQNKNLKPLKELVDDLWWGIASYISYTPYKSLTDAIGKGIFEVKQNSLPPKERY